MSFDDAFCKFPNLESDRLNLREATINDSEQIFHLFNNLEKSHLFVSPRFETMEDAKKFLKQAYDLYSKKCLIDWWITKKGNDKIIGSIRLARFKKQSKRVIGYFISKKYRRQGIMTEAVRAVVKYAFENMRLHRMEATDHRDNQASSKLLRKIGFQKEGLLRKHEWRGEQWSDSVIWSILSDDYKN
ncbi:MAG: GNAT family protein [bacterium]